MGFRGMEVMNISGLQHLVSVCRTFAKTNVRGFAYSMMNTIGFLRLLVLIKGSI